MICSLEFQSFPTRYCNQVRQALQWTPLTIWQAWNVRRRLMDEEQFQVQSAHIFGPTAWSPSYKGSQSGSYGLFQEHGSSATGFRMEHKPPGIDGFQFAMTTVYPIPWKNCIKPPQRRPSNVRVRYLDCCWIAEMKINDAVGSDCTTKS